MSKLLYNDPWAIGEQPEIEWVDKGLFRRDKIRYVKNYWLAVPPEVRAKAPSLPDLMCLFEEFYCDGRSTPVGLIARDHPAGPAHDLPYRAPSWIETMRVLEIDPEIIKLTKEWGRCDRYDVDLMFLEHLRAVGKQQPLVHWNPRRVRAFHALTRHSQWLAVRSPAGKAAWDKWRTVDA